MLGLLLIVFMTIIIGVLAFFCGYFLGRVRTMERAQRREADESVTKAVAGAVGPGESPTAR